MLLNGLITISKHNSRPTGETIMKILAVSDVKQLCTQPGDEIKLERCGLHDSNYVSP